MSALEALLGAHVSDGKGKKISVKEISENNDIVGIYFSAHWCPPCRGFTPQLAVFYEEHRAQGRKFEVVFVSSDRDAGEWAEYFHEMPWLALPYEDRKRKEDLSGKYSVRGIPTLIVLDAKTGQVITSDGRARVCRNPDSFSWN